MAGAIAAASGLVLLLVVVTAFDERATALGVFLISSACFATFATASRLPRKLRLEVEFRMSLIRIVGRGIATLVLGDAVILLLGWLFHAASNGRTLDVGVVFVSVCGGFLLGMGLVWLLACFHDVSPRRAWTDRPGQGHS